METNITTYPDGTKFGVNINSDFAREDESQYYFGSTVTITAVLETFVGDATSGSIEFNLLKPNGELVELITVASSLQDYSIELNQQGTYEYILILTDGDTDIQYKTEGTILNSNNIHFESKKCGSFEIENRSELTYKLSYPSEGIEKLVDLLPNDPYFPVLDVGITQVKIYKSTETLAEAKIYLLNNFCKIEECMARFIEDLLCGDKKECELCPDDTEVAQMMSFYNTYFMKVHALFYQNSYFEALDDSFLSKVTSIESVASKIDEFCLLFNTEQDCSTCF